MRTYRDNLARALRAAWISGLIVTALRAGALPGCRKDSPPPKAQSSPAPASMPAPASEPAAASSPASAPVPVPASAPAPATAPSLPALVLPPGGLAQVRTDAQARREEARKGLAYRDAFESWERAEGKLTAAQAARNAQVDEEARCLLEAAASYDRATKLAAALTRARAELAAQRYPEAAAAVGEALVIDPACVAAIALREDIRLPVGQRDLQAPKA
ncbi:MAG: hypothetical protein NT031_20830, partial [Planctomycetota bacterium]|nr:hypothetical protein [Planctomycetota bacterium]